MTLLCYFIAIVSLLLAGSTLVFQSPTNGQKNNPPVQAPAKPPAATPKPAATPQRTETFWQKVLRTAGISVTPSAMKGDEEGLTGDVHIVDLSSKTSRRLTFSGGYRSPIFLSSVALLALKGEEVMELPLDGSAEKKHQTIQGVVKLVGASMEGEGQILFLKKDGQGQLAVGLLTLSDGQVIVLPYNSKSDEDAKMLAHLNGWERVYDGGKVRLYTKSEQTMELLEVYLKRDSEPEEKITECGDMSCGNPSLSPNGKYVAFIKTSAKK